MVGRPAVTGRSLSLAMASSLDNPACLVCGTPSPLLGWHGDHALHQCPRCGHSFVRTMPSPEVLAAHYERYSYDGVSSLDRIPAFVKKILGEVVDTFEPHRGRDGKLLDVGFGAGALLEAARQRGWRTHGIESSRTAVEEGTERQLGELRRGDFLQAPWEPGSFDVITLVEVIEHLPDPGAFLAQAARLLRPGGLLYLTTPHGRGLSGRLLGASWTVREPPEHVQLFSARSLRESLERHGFARMKIYTQGLQPHELVARARERLGLRRPAQATSRVGDSYQLNQSMVESRVGRVVKREVNRALRLTGLGDGLRAYVTR